ALEIRIERCRVPVGRMGVPPSTIGLPYFNPCRGDRLAPDVEQASRDVDDLACSARGMIGDLSQIAILVGGLQDRIERTEKLVRWPAQARLGKRHPQWRHGSRGTE